jgi:hypothetical protein
VAAQNQKDHDLSGSLASFRVKPLFTHPQQASEPMTRSQINKASADAQADFFHDKQPTYEVAFARAVERHHKIGEKQ